MHLTLPGRIRLARLALVSLAAAAPSAYGAPPADREALPVGLYRGPIMPSAGRGGCGGAMCASSDCHCSSYCCGRDVYCPTLEQVTKQESRWKVRCEKVGIPAIRWPWEPGGSKLTLFSWFPSRHRQCGECVACGSCCPSGNCACCTPKCGPVRCVSVLEKDSYDVTNCKCKWEIRRLPACCCHAGCTGGCAYQAPLYDVEPTDDGKLPAPIP